MSKEFMTRITLVMPTFNRQKYALRSMKYWSNYPVKLIVLDGTESPISESLLEGFGSNIKYIHYCSCFYSRLRKSIDYVKTEFVGLIGDDEFYLPSGLRDSVIELDNDSNLVACIGSSIGFRFNDEDLRYRLVYENHENYFIHHDDPLERMRYHLSDYKATIIYSLTRLNEWKSVVEVMTRREFPVFALGELQYQMIMSFLGKTKVISSLFWFRSFENSPVGDNNGTNPSLSRALSFHEWWNSDKYKEQRDDFILLNSFFLAENSNIVYDIIVESVECSLSLYDKFYVSYVSDKNINKSIHYFDLNYFLSYLEDKGFSCDYEDLFFLHKFIINNRIF